MALWPHSSYSADPSSGSRYRARLYFVETHAWVDYFLAWWSPPDDERGLHGGRRLQLHFAHVCCADLSGHHYARPKRQRVRAGGMYTLQGKNVSLRDCSPCKSVLKICLTLTATSFLLFLMVYLCVGFISHWSFYVYVSFLIGLFYVLISHQFLHALFLIGWSTIYYFSLIFFALD